MLAEAAAGLQREMGGGDVVQLVHGGDDGSQGFLVDQVGQVREECPVGRFAGEADPARRRAPVPA